jgi:tRNA uridine 5-carboxymethylaminomethyl modification enzyme
LLRQDNADLRLSQIGYEIGLLPKRNFQKFQTKSQAIKNELTRLYKTYYGELVLSKILSRPEMSYKNLPNRNEALADEVVQQVEIAVKYAGYIERQESEVQKFRTLEGKTIPDAFDFEAVPGLRIEARQKLTRIRPATIGHAARISGVSPADISILAVCLKRWGANGQSAAAASESSDRNEGACEE